MKGRRRNVTVQGGLQSVHAESLRRRKPLRETVQPYVYLFPLLLVYTVFVIYPALRTFALSLYQIDGIAINAPSRFVGFGNFVRMFQSELFYNSFKHNIYWMLLSLVIPIGFGLLLAVIIGHRNTRGRNLFRTIFFLPQVLTIVAVGLIWSWMYNPRYGPINMVLRAVGLGKIAIPWLGDYNAALFAIFLSYAWAYYGFCMVIFLAGIQAIDDSLYDAAKVDGASEYQQFLHVTLPGLRNAFTTIVLVTLINSFKIFDLIRVITNGGPGDSTYVISFLLYSRVFYWDDVGFGASVAVANTAIIVIISTVFLLYRRRVEKAW
jgi:raffinose/stachyose/melibiose transport system permease protein